MHYRTGSSLLVLVASTALYLLVVGCSPREVAESGAVYDLRGVTPSDDLRPALEQSRTALVEPVRTNRAGQDVSLYNDLMVRIKRPETREEAGEELYRLWAEEPDHFLWIIAAAKHEYLLRRGPEYAEMLSHPVFADTSGPVGAFAMGCRHYGYGSRGEHFLRAEKGMADLDSLQQVLLSLKLANAIGDGGNRLDAVQKLLALIPKARATGGRGLEIFSWYYAGLFLMRDDRLDDALHVAVLGTEMALAMEDRSWQVRFRILLANILEGRREYGSSLAMFNECAHAAIESNLPWLFADSMDRAAALCSALGDPKRSLRFDRRNLEHAIEVGDSLNAPRNMMNVANDFRMLGQLDSSLVYQTQARSWVEAYGDERNMAMLPLLEAEYYCQAGEYAIAESLLLQAGGKSRGATLAIDEARILLGLIRQGLEMGQPDIAYSAVERLNGLRGTLHDNQPDQNFVADYEIAIARFLAGQGEFRQAREALDRAKMAVGSGGGEGKEWEYYQAEGELARLREDLASAAIAFRRSLTIAESSSNQDWIVTSRFSLAHALIEEEQYEEARSLFGAVSPDKSFGGRFRTRLSGAIFLGIAHLREGSYEKGLRQLRRADRMLTPHSPPDLAARLRIEEGRALARLGRPQEAHQSLVEALQILKREGGRAVVDELRAFHEGAMRDVTEALVGLYCDHPSLADTDMPRHTLLLVEENRWGGSTSAKTGEYLDRHITAGTGPIVAYFIGRERSFAWVCTSGSIEIISLPRRSVLAQELLPVLSDMEVPTRPVDANAVARLSEILLGSAVSRWREGTTLHIVPDDLLFFVPWGALRLDESGAPLLERGPIVEGPSIVSLDNRSSHSGPGGIGALLAIGANGNADDAEGAKLRFAEEEARQVAALWSSGPALLRTGSDASWSGRESGSLDTFRVIHIASHAVVHRGLPSRASLQLAGDGEGAPITISSVRPLRLNADLIYLSCCETAMRHSGGEALLDFTRAFLEAGARSVIASTIRVDDEASLFLAVRFYHHWLDGKGKAAALRAAQFDLRASRPEWRHPYYWAFYRTFGSAL